MKTRSLKLILPFIFFVSFSAWARSPHIPLAVVQKLNDLYPNARQVTWKDNNGYEADFVVNNKTGVSMFNEKGELLYSRLTITTADLPEAVTEQVKEYTAKGYIVNSVVQRWYKGRNFYEVEVKKGTENYILHYSKNGKRMGKINKSRLLLNDKRLK